MLGKSLFPYDPDIIEDLRNSSTEMIEYIFNNIKMIQNMSEI